MRFEKVRAPQQRPFQAILSTYPYAQESHNIAMQLKTRTVNAGQLFTCLNVFARNLSEDCDEDKAIESK